MVAGSVVVGATERLPTSEAAKKTVARRDALDGRGSIVLLDEAMAGSGRFRSGEDAKSSVPAKVLARSAPKSALQMSQYPAAHHDRRERGAYFAETWAHSSIVTAMVLPLRTALPVQ